MKLRVDYYSVSPNRFVAGTKGSYGFETMELEFSSEWEGLGKKIVFSPPTGDSVSVIYEGSPIPIPYEVMSKRGVSRFAVVGSDGDKILLSVSGRIDVLETLPADADNSIPPTPEEMQKVLGIMEETSRTARQLEADAAAGKFDGKAAGFGEIGAEMRFLAEGESPSVSVTSEGSNEEKNLTFSFALTEDPSAKKGRYSVRFHGLDPMGVREDDAEGMVADIALGDEVVRNDFDNVPFFRRRICCCTYSPNDRTWMVNAYLGEPGFDWYGGNGEVMYECRPFYYKIEYGESGSPSYVSVAESKVSASYQLAPMFNSLTRSEYRPCFQMGLVDGKPTSRAGLVPHVDSLDGFMEKARLCGKKFHVETAKEWFSDALLLWVEFATKNWQNVFPGATTMARGDEEGAKVLSTPIGNGVQLDKSFYTDGQYVALGSTPYGNEKGDYLQLVFQQNSGNNTATFKLTPSPSTAASRGDYVTPRMWKTGDALLQVNASSGIRNGRDLSKMPFVWRGKENPWGNGSEAICDVLAVKKGTDFVYYYTNDVQSYNGGAMNYNYSSLDILPFSEDGYIGGVTLGNYRFFPTELGATSSTGLCGAYRAPVHDTNVLYVGGGLSDGADAGFMMDFSRAPDEVQYDFSARVGCLD